MTALPLHLRALTAGALLVLGASLAHAQGTAVLPVGDPAYADVDRLLTLGLLDSVIVGQRPWSARELARVVAIARRNATARADALPPGEQALVDGLLRRLETHADRRRDTPRVDLLDDATLVASATNAVRRPLLGSFGPLAEATIDPLARRRLGSPAVRGQGLTLELAQAAEPTGWLALFARERLEARHSLDAGVTSRRTELLRAGVRLRARNVALVVGREQLAWAQREGDGLFLASDAPALDQVSLASDQPFALPGFLRRLGPASATIVAADLGPSFVRSHSKLVAYKLSVAPSRALELGATFENHFGGAGARESSLGNQVIDLLPFIDVFRRHNYLDTTRTLDVESDKALGIDGRLVLHRLGGVVIAGEWLLDDLDATRLGSILTNDAAQSLAVILPRVGSPALSLELSAKRTGIFTYTHTPLKDGMTTRGRLLGDELGPDAKAFGATLRWEPTARARVTVEGRSAIYSDAVYYGAFEDAAQHRWTIHKASSGPDELRDRLVVTLLARPDGRMAVWARAGAERIRNSRFLGDGHAWVAELGARLGG